MLAVSAGHNEYARGAHNRNGFFEYSETLLWARTIQDIFRDKYGNCLLVPAESLSEKVAFINRAVKSQGIKLAVEIHFNSCPGGNAKGSETLFYPGSRAGAVCAERVQRCLGAFLPPNRGAKEGWYKMDRPGIQDFPGDKEGDETPDFFLKETACTALIIEPEFIQNEATIKANREVACEVIAETLAEFLGLA